MKSSTSPIRDVRLLRAGDAREGAGVRKTRRSEALHILPRNATVQRARAEHFIERSFLDRFGSVITDHYPTLLSLQNDDGDVLATVGLRNAARERLFVECYFDESIEVLISQATGAACSRESILELGNMASMGRTASARLIAALSFYLSACRCRYAVVTATRELRRMLGSFGFAWRVLGAARADRLPDLGRSWGSYYQQNPEILVGEIRQRCDRARSHTRAMRVEIIR